MADEEKIVTDEDITQSEETADQLDEQVSDSDDDQITEGVDDGETGDYEGEDDASADQKDGEDKVTPDERVSKLEERFGKVEDALGQIAESLQPGRQKPPQRQPVPGPMLTPVPENIDVWSQKEAVEFSLSESGKRAGQGVAKLAQYIGPKLQIYDQLLTYLLETHPEKENIQQGLAEMNTGSVDFTTAMGKIGTIDVHEENRRLKKQLAQTQKVSRKRGKKASRQSQRPQNAQARSEPTTLHDIVEEALDNLP